ncbi:MAG: GAF domain-containing protein [Candidatus Binatia bacterium]
MEDGRLSSFANAVLSSTKNLLQVLAQSNRKGELTRQVEGMSLAAFTQLVEQVTAEFQCFLESIDMLNYEAFESMLEQVIEAFTLKVGQILDAERATLFLLDEVRDELWSKVAKSDGGRPLDIRMPRTVGVAGHVVSSGQALNVTDAYDEPLFNRGVDEETGYRTRNILCLPVFNRQSRVFGAVQLLNKNGAAAFDAADAERLKAFTAALAIVLESWCRMHERQTGAVRASVAQHAPSQDRP